MNWEFVLSFVLAFCLVFVIFMTLGYYINFQRAKRAQKKREALDPLSGRYFSRFIPEHLEEKYDTKSLKKAIAKEKTKYSRITKALVLIPLGLFFVITAVFAFRHQEYIYAPVQLSFKEISNLSHKKYDWINESKRLRPHMGDVADSLQEKTLVFISSEKDKNWILPSHSRSLSATTMTAWKIWAEEQGVEWKHCFWKNSSRCLRPHKNSIAVVLPGFWPLKKMTSLLKKEVRMLILGPPAQIYRANNDHLSWHNIKFQRKDKPEQTHILLKGRQRLTLGWDSATILPVPRIDSSFRVSAKISDALRINEKGLPRGEIDTSMVSFVENNSKVVWADFIPPSFAGSVGPAEEVNSLAASIFRFLTDQAYSDIAPWPADKAFAAFFSLEAGQDYEKLGKHIDKLQKLSTPIAPFLVTKVAEANRHLTRKIAKNYELNCQADEHTPFDRDNLPEQTKRIALCLKSIQNVGKHLAKGLRPPEEQYNSDTLSAAKNLGIEYLFVGPIGQFSPKIMVDVDSNSRLLEIGRATSSDVNMLVKNKMALQDMRQLALDEIKWMKLSGGIYNYEIHSHLLERVDNIELIKHIDQALQALTKKVYLASPSAISDWWRFRANLKAGMNPTKKELDHYKPVVLSVDKSGQPTKVRWGAKRDLSSNKNDK